jgi:hypothetical protein
MRTLIVMLLLGGGCVKNQRDLARWVDTSLLATSTASISCDWGYTHAEADRGWRGTREMNPMLGPTPSIGVVNAYFVSMLALNGAAWVLIPAKWRAAIPLAVTTRQAIAISSNVDVVGSVCGF